MKVLAGLLLTFLLGAMFIGLLHMSAGMEMSGSMADCPSMTHGEVICGASLAEHIGTWKAVFLSTTAVFGSLLAAAGAALLVASVAPHLLRPRQTPIPIVPRQLRERTYTFSYRPLQELFSRGILHPKLF